MSAFSSSKVGTDSDSLRPYIESINLYEDYVMDALAPRLYEWLLDYWNHTQEKLAKEQYLVGPMAPLVAFQEALLKIQDWEEEQVISMVKALFGDNADEAKKQLRTALSRIVAANTALLGAAAPREVQQDLVIESPAPGYFIHQVLVSVAEYLYRKPERMQQVDEEQLIAVIQRSIKTAIRRLTPYSAILKDISEQITAAPAAAAPVHGSSGADTDIAPLEPEKTEPAQVAVHKDAKPEEKDVHAVSASLNPAEAASATAEPDLDSDVSDLPSSDSEDDDVNAPAETLPPAPQRRPARSSTRQKGQWYAGGGM